METKTLIPWLIAGVASLFALGGFMRPSTPQPWQPPTPYPCPDCYPNPNVNPYQPNVPPRPCPCPRCTHLENSFQAERAAMRRELARTQLNLAQVQREVGKSSPIKVADWLFFSPAGSSTGSVGSVEQRVEIGSAPTEAPSEK